MRILVLVYLGILLLLMLFENRYIFIPSRYPDGEWRVNERDGREGASVLRVTDVWLTAADGVRLHGWLARPHVWRNGQAEPVPHTAVILWCHGNAGNIAYRAGKLAPLAEHTAVFLFDYRGYGRSEGSPDEDGVYRDARAAWDWLTGEGGYAPERTVIYGVSLGGAVAIELATQVNAAGLIVESSFTSIPDMAAETMPFVPGFLIRTRMDSLARIERLACPKLFIHSKADEIIPYRMGRALFDAAPEPKRFYDVPGDPSHNDTDIAGGAPYFATIRGFVREVTE